MRIDLVIWRELKAQDISPKNSAHGRFVSWESAIAQMGVRRSSVLLFELHINWIRVRASPASIYFHTGSFLNFTHTCPYI